MAAIDNSYDLLRLLLALASTHHFYLMILLTQIGHLILEQYRVEPQVRSKQWHVSVEEKVIK